MSFAKIKSALVSAYETGAFGLPTAYENRDFDPINTGPWAAVYVIPNQPEVATLGSIGTDQHEGILQIDLNYPAGAGDGDVLTKADEIGAVFKAGTYVDHDGQQVYIVGCGRSQGRRELGMYRISLTIEWYARTAR